MRALALCLSVSALSLCGCAAAATPPQTPAAPPFKLGNRVLEKIPAVTVRPLETPAVPQGLVLRLPAPPPSLSLADKPLERIKSANKAAVQEPRTDSYINAIQIYPYIEGALYRLYGAPDHVTDISLQGGEQLIAISAGDTARWIIGNTHSGSGPDARVHILVKPQLAGLKTNLIIATDRRTYQVQMESTPGVAMAALSWRYPQDDLLAIKVAAENAAESAPIAETVHLDDLHFGYTISGATAAWRPVRAFDDGARVYIEFPATLKTGDAPPLFVVGKGGQAQLTNYTLRRNYYVVDGLFEVAELRLGEKPQAIVRISTSQKADRRHD